MGVMQFMMVNQLITGCMFGELGIIYNRPRAAASIALTEIELGVMDKTGFNEAFGAFQKMEEKKKRNFVEDYIIADPALNYLAPKIGIMFEKRTLIMNSVIYRQGEVPSKLYFVIRGCVRFRFSWKAVQKQRQHNMRRTHTYTAKK